MGKSAPIPADGKKVPDLELIPHASPRVAPRVIGPGRRERTYQERVRRLEGHARQSQRDVDHLARELDVAQRLERGCQRLIDRIEVHHEKDRTRLVESEQREKRLVLALGALQRDNERLQERLAATGPGPKRLRTGERPLSRTRRSWLDRLLGRSGA